VRDVQHNTSKHLQDDIAEQKLSRDEILNHELSSAVSHKQAEPQRSEGDDLYEDPPETHLEIDERHQSHALQQVEHTKELQDALAVQKSDQER
jgi:hypothetical protein